MTTLNTARSLNYIGVANTFTGHGRVSMELMTHMLLRNVSLRWFPLCYSERDHNPVPDCFKQTFVQQLKGPGLFWASYDHTVNPDNNGSMRYVVHESENIPCEAIKLYNQTAGSLATPSQWNVEVLRRSGWRGKIYIVPHGVSSNFTYWPINTDPFVFGCVVRYGSMAARRKNIQQLIHSFQEAFPHTHNNSIQLWIKSFPDDYEIDNLGDGRVKVIREYWDQSTYIKWLRKLSVYVNISSGEGWCMPLHEALAIGRPVITPFHGGITEYVTDKCAYRIPFRRVKPPGGFYKNQTMIEPQQRYVVEAMRHCVSNIQDVIAKGLAGTQRAHSFSWNTAGTKMYNALLKEGLIK